jgi:CRISPR-associated protein Cas2
MFVIVTYDIADDARRYRVMKMLKGYGEHVQESVFECDLTQPVYREMAKRLQDAIKDDEDNVRLYHLHRMDVSQIVTMGVGQPVQQAQVFRVI